jgi:hypothetical protein
VGKFELLGGGVLIKPPDGLGKLAGGSWLFPGNGKELLVVKGGKLAGGSWLFPGNGKELLGVRGGTVIVGSWVFPGNGKELF